MTFLIKKVGLFEGISTYESSVLGNGAYSGGLALPGFGIVVGIGTFSDQKGIDIVRHEYGHFLQAQLTGRFIFYLCIGLPSLMSAWTNWHKKSHSHYWTEGWCNHLAKNHFKDIDWSDNYPSKDISDLTKYWLIPTHRSDKNIYDID